jgi:micrococcal nuclease
MPVDAIPCPSAYVVDGDSLRCGSVRVRLLGIDAPELHGCLPRRQCVAGDGQVSRHSLVGAVRSGRVTYRVVTYDRYGRSVAVAWAGSVNLSCWQLRKGHAAYVARWDNGRLIAAACR